MDFDTFVISQQSNALSSPTPPPSSQHNLDPNHNHHHIQPINAPIIPLPQIINAPTIPLSDAQFLQRVQSYSLDPGIQNPKSPRKLCWPPNHYTKCRILAVKELYAERVSQGFIDQIPWAEWLPAMLGHLPAIARHCHVVNGQTRFKTTKKMKAVKVAMESAAGNGTESVQDDQGMQSVPDHGNVPNNGNVQDPMAFVNGMDLERAAALWFGSEGTE